MAPDSLAGMRIKTTKIYEGDMVRKLEKEAIRFPAAHCLLKPAAPALYSGEKRVETLVAHPLAMTFPLTSRTSFVAVEV